MRCRSCDRVLKTQSEISRKYKTTGEYLDLCDGCTDTISTLISTVTSRDRSNRSGADFGDDDEQT